MDKVGGSAGPRRRYPLAVPLAALATLLVSTSTAVGAPDVPADSLITPAYADSTGGELRPGRPGSLSPANPSSVKRTVQKLSPKGAPATDRISPNSRVGLVAAYVDAVEAAAKAEARIAALDRQMAGLGSVSPGDSKLQALKAERSKVAAARDTLLRAQRDALDATASKPMTEELLSAINAILGIESATEFTGDGKTGFPAAAKTEAGSAGKSLPPDPLR